MQNTMELTIPAERHMRYAPSAAASMVGQEFDLDERIAGFAGLVTRTLSADERGLWTRAKVIDAEIVDAGCSICFTIESI